MQGDGDALAKSRIYRLEQSLARGLVKARRLDHVTAVGAEARALLAEARALLESRRSFVAEQVDELAQLQGKNQRLADTLGKKAADERQRIEDARTALLGLRTVYNRHADELARLLNPNEAREAGIRARMQVLASPFSAGIGGALDGFFADCRGRIARAIELIGEVRAMMATVNRRFAEDYGISPVELADFTTERFNVELERLEERCNREFRTASSLITRGRRTLGALFFDTVALKAIHVFEIADREVRTWMNAFIRPLEAQVNASQSQANSRIEGMARIRNAESDLADRLAELGAFLQQSEVQRREWEAHQQRLTKLLEAGREGVFSAGN
jgi:chromosome segregation ATPase